jgi:hypothetical protein
MRIDIGTPAVINNPKNKFRVTLMFTTGDDINIEEVLTVDTHDKAALETMLELLNDSDYFKENRDFPEELKPYVDSFRTPENSKGIPDDLVLFWPDDPVGEYQYKCDYDGFNKIEYFNETGVRYDTVLVW